MRCREISEAEASVMLLILERECGYRISGARSAERFIQTMVEGCPEYRFQGALGFGGKIRNNGNNANIPYVDCYPEDETAARQKMIARANSQLRRIFADTPIPDPSP